MYQLVSALGRQNKIGGRWVSVEIGEMSFSDLFGLYSSVYANLTNPLFTGSRTFDLNILKPSMEGSSQTFNDYLVSIADQRLEDTATRQSVSTQYVTYSDAFQAQYKIEPISPLGHIDSTILMSDRHWLSLTREGTDINYFFNHCLISVNGFIHQTDSDGQRLYIVDGMRSARLACNTAVGITNFASIGALEFVSIKESMIHRRYSDFGYNKSMYIDLGAVYSGTPMLVLGGYLHVLDHSVFSRINEQIFSINFFNVQLKERYFESRDKIDLSSLGLDHTLSNPERIDLAELYSDEVLLKYATLSQSFIVFVDNDSLFVEKEVLAPSLIANTYVSYTEPKYPLVTGFSKLSEYWRVYEDQRWVLKVNDNIKNNFEFNTTFDQNLVCIDNARTPAAPAEYSRAQFLVIGSDFLVTSTV